MMPPGEDGDKMVPSEPYVCGHTLSPVWQLIWRRGGASADAEREPRQEWAHEAGQRTYCCRRSRAASEIGALQGTVHSFDLRDQVLVAWDGEDPEDPADSCSVPRRLLQKI